jgi:hypothetical protein
MRHLFGAETHVPETQQVSKGEIFGACRISATHISAPKNVSISIEHFFVFSTTVNLFGAEIGVAEIWQASKIWPIV